MKIIRRILLFLAIIISVLWIEAAHADMSAPDVREFEVVVVNPDGVDYYDYKDAFLGHLNKDDIVVVMYEYDGKYTLGSKEKNNWGGHETLGYVKSMDAFSIVQEEVDPTKLTDDNSIQKHDTPQLAKVNAEEGVDIYKGPSSVYKKVGHIKKGTSITYKYSSYGTYIYVEYDGVKGWVEILHGKVLIPNNEQYIFSTDVVTECGTVPKNSIVTPTFRTDRWTHKAVFEYNGCEFMHNTLKDEEVYSIYPYNRVVSKDISLYEYADKTSNVLATIPSGTEVLSLAADEQYYGEKTIMYVEYNGTRGWIVEEGNVISSGSQVDDSEEVKVEDTIKIEDIELPKNEENGGSVVMPRSNFTLIVFILLCVFGVSILAVTAVVIIILVNKSKKTQSAEEKNVKEK